MTFSNRYAGMHHRRMRVFVSLFFFPLVIATYLFKQLALSHGNIKFLYH